MKIIEIGCWLWWTARTYKMNIMVGCGTKYQMSRSPEHKNSLGSTNYALIKWEIGPYLITFEKKHPVFSVGKIISLYRDQHLHSATFNCFPEEPWYVEEASLEEEDIADPLVVFVVDWVFTVHVNRSNTRMWHINTLLTNPPLWYWECSMEPAIWIHVSTRNCLQCKTLLCHCLI